MASRDLVDLNPLLAQAWIALAYQYSLQNPGKSLGLTCTWRSIDEQKVLYAQGRTTPGQIITYVDGVNKLSNHNYRPARAMDFAVMVAGKITWDEAEYKIVGKLAKEHGLAWGGDWKTLKDYPHLEFVGLS